MRHGHRNDWLLIALVLASCFVRTPSAIDQEPSSEPSVARLWNEALQQSIREGYARPTVHARNLYHLSVAMWDAWAMHDVAIASRAVKGRYDYIRPVSAIRYMASKGQRTDRGAAD